MMRSMKPQTGEVKVAILLKSGSVLWSVAYSVLGPLPIFHFMIMILSPNIHYHWYQNILFNIYKEEKKIKYSEYFNG